MFPSLTIRFFVVFGLLLQAFAAPPFHAQGEQAPFTGPQIEATDAPLGYPLPGQGLSIAIIGAGAAGSSAAYWLSLASERLQKNIQITVFDNSSKVGGRSAVAYPYDDTSLPHVELGASVFIETDRNMMRAVRELGLTFKENGDDTNKMGIWNGEKFVLELGTSKGMSFWWNAARVIWRYGVFAPKRANYIVNKMLKKFSTLYTPSGATWGTINSLVENMDLRDATVQTAGEYLRKEGVSERFVNEMADAMARNAFEQDVATLHGFGSLVSLTAERSFRVREGNHLLFESFLNRSDAILRLDSQVYRIEPNRFGGMSTVYYSTKGLSTALNFGVVIIAAPFDTTQIDMSIVSRPQAPPKKFEDRMQLTKVHVTVLSTTMPYPSPVYFYGQGSSKIPPRVVLTSSGPRRAGKGPEPEFYSLSYLDIPGVGEKGEQVVKIVSMKRISDEWLSTMFGGQVGWVHRKEWISPVLKSTSSYAPVRVADGMKVYYINSMEPLVSTMESTTIQARNVVDMILRDQFGRGICGYPPRSGSEVEAMTWDKSKIYGWDC